MSEPQKSDDFTQDVIGNPTAEGIASALERAKAKATQATASGWNRGGPFNVVKDCGPFWLSWAPGLNETCLIIDHDESPDWPERIVLKGDHRAALEACNTVDEAHDYVDAQENA